MDSKKEELKRLQGQLNNPNIAGRKLYWGDWWLPRVRARLIRRIVELKRELNNGNDDMDK